MKKRALLLASLVLLPLLLQTVSADLSIEELSYPRNAVVGEIFEIHGAVQGWNWEYIEKVELFNPNSESIRDRECHSLECSFSWKIAENYANTYRYTLKVTGYEGNTLQRSFSVIVSDSPVPSDNEKPVAVMNSPKDGATYHLTEGEVELTFDASGSDDSDGSIIKYLWTVDKESYPLGTKLVNTPTTMFRLTETGNFKIHLTVQDDDLAWSDSVSVDIVVKDGGVEPVDELYPIASITTEEVRGTAPFEVTFDLSGTNDPDGNVVFYELDFGDGESVSKSVAGDAYFNGLEIGHTYEDYGVYNAVLTVRDNDYYTDSDKVKITVNYSGSYSHGGSGGSGSDDTYSGGSSGSTAVVDGELIISENQLTLEAGDITDIDVTILNTGSAADFEVKVVKANFGEVESEGEVYLMSGDRERVNLGITVDDDAEGSYILKLQLLRNGEVVDSSNIYITVEESGLSGFAVVTVLLIIALCGLAGLGYYVYKGRNEKP